MHIFYMANTCFLFLLPGKCCPFLLHSCCVNKGRRFSTDLSSACDNVKASGTYFTDMERTVQTGPLLVIYLFTL